jgi:hypothetical protein
VGSVMGQIVRFWPVFLEERAFVWVDELAGNVEFAVLHLFYRGFGMRRIRLCYKIRFH